MRVQRLQQELSPGSSYVLLDDEGQPIQVVSGFLSHLHARGLSPNTQAAYAYDLLHFLSFLKEQQLTYGAFSHPVLMRSLTDTACSSSRPAWMVPLCSTLRMPIYKTLMEKARWGAAFQTVNG